MMNEQHGSLVADIKNYLAGNSTSAPAVLLSRALDALTQRDDEPDASEPTLGGTVLYIGAAVRCTSRACGMYRQEGTVVTYNPTSNYPFWVAYESPHGHVRGWYAAWELELIP